MYLGLLKQIKSVAWRILFFAALCTFSQVHAQTGPTNLNVSGALYLPSGLPVTNSTVNFRLEIWNKNSTCMLYSEQHLGEDLSASKGGFSLAVGRGTSPINYLESTAVFSSKLFENTGAVAGGWLNCPSGANFVSGDERTVRVHYDLGGGFVAMSPDVPIASSAYALIADTLQGKRPTDFVQLRDDMTYDLNQANVENVFSSTNYARLQQLLNPSAALGFGGQRLTNLADPSSAQDASTKAYADGKLAGQTIDLADVAPGFGGGKVLAWDSAASKWVAMAPTIAGTAGGDLSGSYPNPTVANLAIGTSKLADNAVTSAKISTTGLAPNQLVITDNLTGANLKYATCSNDEILKFVTGTGWQCATVASLSAVASVNGKTGTVVLNGADLGLGTASMRDIGIGTSNVPELGAGGKLATGVIPNFAGDLSGAFTSAFVAGIQGRAVADTAPNANEVLRWNGTLTRWEPSALVDNVGITALTGDVSASGTGSVAATLTNGVVTTPKMFATPGANRLVATDATTGATLVPFTCNLNESLQWTASGWACANPSTAFLGSNVIIDGGNARGADISIGTTDNFALNFKTNNSNKMTILANGFVGIGITAPSMALDVYGNARSFTMTATNFYGGSGSLGNPAFASDGGGMFSPATNVLAFTTNTAERIRITSAGNVGIGTTNPGRLLSVNGSINVAPSTLPGSPAAGDIAIDADAANSLKYHNGSNWVSLAVGGTGDFMANGSVAMTGQLRSIAGSAASPGVTFIGDTDNGIFAPAADNFAITTSGSEKLRVLANGNVGVGITNPASLLAVQGSSDGSGTNITTKNNSTGQLAQSLFGATNDGSTSTRVGITGTGFLKTYLDNSEGFLSSGGVNGLSLITLTNSSPIRFLSGSNTTPTEKMRIQGATGYVGIGTTSPSRLLSVNGAINVAPDTLPGSPAAGDIAIDSGAANSLKYHNGSNWISIGNGTGDFMANGSVAMTGQFRSTAGTASAPGMAFNGDTDNGIFAPATDNTAVATAGVERLRVLSDGRVGIGTSSPFGRLHVNNEVGPAKIYVGAPDTEDRALILQSNTSGKNWSMRSPSLSTDLAFGHYDGVSDKQLMTLAASGHLGIGTTAPWARLAIGSSDANAKIGILNDSSTTGRLTGIDIANFDGAGFAKPPELTLSYSRGSSLSQSASQSGDTLGRLVFQGNRGGVWTIPARIGAVATENQANNANGGALIFETTANGTNSSTLAERMRVDQSGFVGIGTTSPARMLHVVGPIRITPTVLPSTPIAGDIALDSGAANSLKYHNGSNWVSLAVGGTGDFMANGSVAMTGQFRSIAGTALAPGMTFTGDTDNGTFAPAADNVAIATSGVERLRVLANGNVGVGISNPSVNLEVDSQMRISSVGTSYLSFYGTQAQILSNAGGMKFISSGSNTTSFETNGAERLRIDSTGRLGIGSTSPAVLIHGYTNQNADTILRVENPNVGGAATAVVQAKSAAGSLIMTAYSAANGNTGQLTSNYPYLDLDAENASGVIRFHSGGTAASNERMRIDATGKIGIGTSAPARLLEVAGALRVSPTVSPGTPAAGDLFVDSAAANVLKYHNGSSWVSLAGGGVGDFMANGTVAMTGQLRSIAGMAAAPGLSFVGDTDNGIFAPAADNVAIGTSGTEKLRVLANGNVGLGTSTPVQILHIRSPLDNKAILRLDGPVSSTSAAIEWASNGSVKWQQSYNATSTRFEWYNFTQGSETMVLTDSGRVGIGTTSPSRLLQVAGAMKLAPTPNPGTPTAGDIFVDLTSSNTLKYHNGSNWISIGSGTGDFLADGSVPMTGQFRSIAGTASAPGVSFVGDTDTGIFAPTADNVAIGTSGAERMRIAANGNVGIGTTSPGALFHVSNGRLLASTLSGGITDILHLLNTHSSITQDLGVSMRFKANVQDLGDIGSAWSTSADNTNAYMRFQTRTASALTEKMRIESSGKVGIGTTAPNRLLEVRGPVRISPMALPGSPAAGDLAFDSGDANALKYHNGSNWISIGNGTGDFLANGSAPMTGQFRSIAGTAVAPGMSFVGDTDNGIFSPAADAIAVTTSGSEKVRVLGNGNVGIGVTSPLALLDVGGRAIIRGSGADTESTFVSGGNGSSTGPQNTFVGFSAGSANTTGQNNVAVGYSALSSNTTGSGNQYAGNVAIGSFALQSATNTELNTAVGNRALNALVSGSHNTALGGFALGQLTNGFFNVAIGRNAGSNQTTGWNNIIIGADVDAPVSTGSQQLNIGNLIYGTGIAAGSTPSGGYVGIGTTSPSRLLQVAGAMKITPTANPGTPTAGDIFVDSAASNALKYHNGSSWVTLAGGGGGGDFMANGSVAMTGPLRSSAGTTATPGLTFDGDTDNGISLPGPDQIAISTGGVERARFLANGYLGLGVTNPAVQFDVVGPRLSTSYPAMMRIADSAGYAQDVGGGISFGGKVDATTAIYHLGIIRAGKENGTVGNEAGYLSFQTRPNGVFATTERMRISSTGNIGIGTTSPTRLLQVAGAMKITPTANPATPTAGDIFVDSAAANILKYHNGSSWISLDSGGSGDFMADGSVPMTGQLRTIASGTAAAPGITFTGDTDNGIFRPAADTFAVTTAGSERLRLSSVGSLGIGATSPSASAKLHIKPTSSAYMGLLVDKIDNTSGGVVYLNDNTRTFVMDVDSGHLRFNIHGANLGVFNSTAMVIDPTGEVAT